jgi:hypothetical protein
MMSSRPKDFAAVSMIFSTSARLETSAVTATIRLVA